MSHTAADVHDLLRKIRYDLTAAQAKVTELAKAIDTLAIRDTADPDRPRPQAARAWLTNAGHLHLPREQIAELTDRYRLSEPEARALLEETRP